ncbi:hypothetical protein [Streptomyces caniscabiei]|uniref:DUF4352 domain-containing protein n=1 Tax=Streptomyces caniscabiei TaxID=2746961 RepID=A0A927L9T2_9ACTN|nr:hypothetical protein [Streptomyces caniscabiei]MBD9725108.1 hypothetical protein [Streptomyces caniscabiei]MDX3510317.1 hypothetical protein [Streptomyces caniscabiei]MDX3720401.1 hypothetical protein [Streptomyces caniscabiei]WEO26295.1 hypothetical protein IHE65_25775 [Streptomyces caniscabiei]
MSHDITPPPMPGFGPPIPPQPPKPPGGNRTNLIIVGCAVAVVASVIGTGIVVTKDGDGSASPAPTVTVTKTVAAEDADTTGDDSTGDGDGGGDSGDGTEDSSEDASDTATDDDGVFALDDEVVYDSEVEVALSGFKRGVSSEYAVPERTPYVKFSIKITNGSDATVDANELTVNCAYGDQGKEGEAIYDDGLDGLPDTRILAGRSLTVPWACELPKSETFLQVEVSPDWDSEEAIFTGDVKK